MELSLNSIASTVSGAALSAGAAMQAVGSSALSAASHATSSVAAGAAASTQLTQGLKLVEQPVSAAAKAANARSLATTAKVLGKALGVTAVAGSALAGYSLTRKAGVDALLETQQGRGAVLSGVGGACLLTPFPPVQLLGALTLGAYGANAVGAFERLDQPQAPDKRRP